MSATEKAWATVALCVVTTAAIRAFGPVTVGGRTFGPRTSRVLALLPAALLSALVVTETVIQDGALDIDARLAGESLRHARAVGLEERFATLLPEVLIGIGLEQFAALAAKAMEPKPVIEVSLHHIHANKVSVREQAALVVERLRRSGTMTFRALCGDSPDTLTTVARFLSLLELFREGAVSFDQMSPLGELTVRWTGAEEGEVEITDEFDGTTPDPDEPAAVADDADTEESGMPADDDAFADEDRQQTEAGAQLTVAADEDEDTSSD